MNASTQLAPLAPESAVDSVIAAALRQDDVDLDRVERFLALKREYEADEARKAFIAAKAAFKAESIHITRDKTNNQYGSNYTSLGNLVNTVTPFLSKHGLSAEWDQKQSTDGKSITVFCRLSHSMGHKEETSFIVPPDASGSKNAIQQLKSAITYARALTFEAICGLASSDANLDDDGNGTGNPDAAVTDPILDKIGLAETVEQLQAIKPEVEAAKVVNPASKKVLIGAYNARLKKFKA